MINLFKNEDLHWKRFQGGDDFDYPIRIEEVMNDNFSFDGYSRHLGDIPIIYPNKFELVIPDEAYQKPQLENTRGRIDFRTILTPVRKHIKKRFRESRTHASKVY